MKLFATTRAGRLRSAIILLLFLGVIGYYRMDRVALYFLSHKQEGDILFQSLPRADLVDAIEGISNSEWSHCGILVKRDGRWEVAEAIGAVRYTPLYAWIVRGRRSKIASYRLTQAQPADAPAKINTGIQKLLGRPYDFRYAPEDSEIYCSELVYKVYDRELNLPVGTWERLGDLNWKPYEPFIRYMENGNLPLDRLMITPVALTRSPLVTQVW